MKKTTKQFIVAVATLAGTIIGVGMFGTPYAISQIGWPLAVGFFLVLGAVQLMQHLFLAEAAAACDEQVRFTGLVYRYLGPNYRKAATLVWSCGIWASVVAYILLGGQFLFTIFSPMLGGPPIIYQLGWGIVGSILISRNLDFIGRLEVIGTIGLALALGVILGVSLPEVKAANFEMTVVDPLLAYGIILFSLAGVSAVTELEEEVSSDLKLFRWSIVTGLILTGVITFLFGFIVYGVTGENTTQDAVTGLQGVLDGVVPLAAAAFGFLAVATSFIGVATDLKNLFRYDYKMSPFVAWSVTVAVPLLIILVGARSFLTVISFSAAVFGGVTAAMIAFMYIKITKRNLLGENRLGVPIWMAYITIIVLLSGALIQVASTIHGWIT